MRDENRLVIFWSQVEKTDSCWLWKGRTIPKGYGMFSYGSKDMRVHRLSYEVLVGPIPEGLVLDHLCRIKLCVNPEHLEAVTQRENVLRGVGPTAIHARKTHCLNGHEFTDEVKTNSKRGRECNKCQIQRWRDYRLRKKLGIKVVRTPGKVENPNIWKLCLRCKEVLVRPGSTKYCGSMVKKTGCSYLAHLDRCRVRPTEPTDV